MSTLKLTLLGIGGIGVILVGLLLSNSEQGRQDVAEFHTALGHGGKPDTQKTTDLESLDAPLHSLSSDLKNLNQASPRDSNTAQSRSRYEELLASVDAIRASRKMDAEQLGLILQAADVELNAAERIGVVNAIANLVAERDIDLGLELVKLLRTERDRHNFVKAIVDMAIKNDPLGTTEWAHHLEDSALRIGAFNVIGMKWGEADLEASLSWAETLQDPSLKVSAMEGLAWIWTQEDPDAAFDWAVQVPEPKIRDQVFLKIAKMVSVKNPKQGSEWALEFPEGSGRNAALDYAVFQWASKDLAGVGEWVSQIQDSELRGNSLVAIARAWSTQDPQRATAWASDIPDNEMRAAALITTSRKWAESAPAEAARWLESIPDASTQDRVLRSITSSLSDMNPQVAASWINSIQDTELRATGEGVAALKLLHENRAAIVPVKP